jgi:NADH-quinone oxidoreductase subunit F
VIEEKIPLPGTVGRVCPRPCEGKCHRGHLDTPIAINGLKRFVADTVAVRRGRNDVVPPKKTKEEKVAIIGSGPAGLTTAFHLVKLGYPTTIFEALAIPGGMLTVGIPEYRLPREVVQSEIENIQKQGVEIRLNSPIGMGKGKLSIDHLWRQGYKAIFIATGAHKSLRLGIPGEEMKGVYDGIPLLKDVNLGKKIRLGKRVIVVGGGNVAIDAARVARRFGVKEVSILYRRSEEEMPAYREEVEAAKAEAIEIHYLTSPTRIMGKDGKVTKLECIKTRLGEADESGRRRPEPVKGSEFVIEADTVVPAIGEIPDLSFLDAEKFDTFDGAKPRFLNRGKKRRSVSTLSPSTVLGALSLSKGIPRASDRGVEWVDWTENKTIRIHPRTMMTNTEGIFAGGDVVSGPATVIEAMAAGRKAALSIDQYLRGERLEDEASLPRIIGIEEVDLDRFNGRERQRMPALPMEERTKGFKEIELGFAEMEALCEADRCFQCGLFPKKHD